jgi:hypothetical protein
MDAAKATIQSSVSQLRAKLDDSVTLQKLEVRLLFRGSVCRKKTMVLVLVVAD